MNFTLIAAVADNRVIGYQNTIPWRIPEDMKRFKTITMGHPVIMGKTTYLSIPPQYRPLKGRTNIVLSRSELIHEEGIVLCHSLEEALERASSIGEHVFCAGGQQVYEEAIHLADTLEITHVHQKPEGDAFFPEIDTSLWHELARDARGEYDFATYIRTCATMRLPPVFLKDTV